MSEKNNVFPWNSIWGFLKEKRVIWIWIEKSKYLQRQRFCFFLIQLYTLHLHVTYFYLLYFCAKLLEYIFCVPRKLNPICIITPLNKLILTFYKCDIIFSLCRYLLYTCSFTNVYLPQAFYRRYNIVIIFMKFLQYLLGGTLIVVSFHPLV